MIEIIAGRENHIIPAFSKIFEQFKSEHLKYMWQI